MTRVESLWLVWQHSKNRSYYHIGTLSYFNNHYEFSYTKDGSWKLRDALDHGYMLHPAFPDDQKVYSSKNLFAAFDRRLPSQDRSDFKDILNDLGLDKLSTKMELLEETRGRLVNDMYSFERPLRVENDGKIHTSFFIHGMRYQNLSPEWPNWLPRHQIVKLTPEPENEFDPYAVAIYTQGGKKLGYVPGFYSMGIYSLIENGANPAVHVTYVNEKSTPNWWVKVVFASEIPHLERGKITARLQSSAEVAVS